MSKPFTPDGGCLTTTVAGLRRAPGGAGAATAGAPDEIPRRVRAAQPVAGRGDAGGAGATQGDGPAHARRAPPGHDVGAVAEAGLRDRDLRGVREEGQGHRQHRGPGRDRDDPRAPGIAGAAGPGRVPDAGASQTEGLAGRYSGLADALDGTFEQPIVGF